MDKCIKNNSQIRNDLSVERIKKVLEYSKKLNGRIKKYEKNARTVK